jgi:ribosomal protein L37AE/L43A
MNAPQLPPLPCPQCRSSVVPKKAAIGWYCPHCGWRFLERDIVEAVREAERAEKENKDRQGG